MKRTANDAPPESDRFADTPHPRETFDLFGHAAVEVQLLDAWRAGRLPQSIILGGPEGIGKATLAWRLARFLLAHPDPASPEVAAAENLFVAPTDPSARRIEALAHSDVFLLRREWNSERKRMRTEIRVDDVRHMIERFHQASASGGWRIAIVDAADDLNRSSANAMLKLIEEPPPRSLFLFVANRPARIMPTIRSRSRMVSLAPLSVADTIAAVRALGEDWLDIDHDALDKAAARSGGSVKQALRLLDSDSGVLDDFDAIAARFPEVDWRTAHSLAEKVSSREKTEDFEAIVAAMFDWISVEVRARAGTLPASGAGLAQLADLWDKIAESARQVEIYNLDRRPFMLTALNDLAGAARIPVQ